MYSPCVVIIALLWPVMEIACDAAPLLDETLIVECTITVQGNSVQVRVLPDDKDDRRFYYIPPQPFVETRQVNVVGREQTRPVFHITKFQERGAIDDKQFVQGSIVEFALSLELPPIAINDLRREVRRESKERGIKIPDDRGIEVLPIPIRNAYVQLFAPQDDDGAGLRLTTAGRETLLAPPHVGGTVPFSMSLTKTETGLFTALMSSTGLPMTFTLEHEAVAPVAGYSVHLNWENIRKFFVNGADRHAMPGMWVVTTWVQENEIGKRTNQVENALKQLVLALVNSDCIHFTSGGKKLNTGIPENLNAASLALQVIYKEVFGRPVTPHRYINGFVESTGDQANGFSIANEIPLDEKRALKLQATKATIDFETPNRVQVPATVKGFLSISQFIDRVEVEQELDGKRPVEDDDLLRRFISYPDSNQWQAAYFLLPTTMPAEQLGLSQVTLVLTVTEGSTDLESTTVSWKDGVWRGKDGQPARRVPFSLQTLKLETAKFRVETTIRTKDDTFEETKIVSMFSGVLSAGFSLENIEVVEIDAGSLTFDDGLVSVDVEVIPPQRNHRIVRRKLTKDSPRAFVILQTEEKLRYRVKAKFRYQNKTTRRRSSVDWKYNNVEQFDHVLDLDES